MLRRGRGDRCRPPGLSLARCVWATLSQATQALARTTGPPLPSREGRQAGQAVSLARFDLARLLLLDASLVRFCR